MYMAARVGMGGAGPVSALRLVGVCPVDHHLPTVDPSFRALFGRLTFTV